MLGTITKYIVQTLNLGLSPEPSNADWQMFDDGSVETGVGELLYGFIRGHRPFWSLETGTYHGISSSYLGLALKENNYGYLDAVEYEQQHLQLSKERWSKLDISERVYEHLISSLEFVPQHNYDFIFLDTEPNLRFNELVRFYPYLNEGGYVFIHDLPRGMCQGNINPDLPDFKSWPYGDLPEEIKQWLRSGELIKFHFNSPRGLTGLYKKHLGDYKWE